MRAILRVDAMLCQSCERCQARLVCKTRAIVQFESGDLPVIQAERCRGCQVCIQACPSRAIALAEWGKPNALPSG
jgi:MinD superfamily P-loop ATPase